MPFAPEAYIVGAAKSGTTTLADLLDSHPDISVSDPKEPDFFTLVDHRARGESWYRRCFAGRPARVRIDASTSYGMAPLDGPTEGVPAAIHRRKPDARIIFVLRDPIARAWSSYWHAVRAGWEDRPFDEAVRDPAGFHQRGSLYHARINEYLAVFPRQQLLLLEFEQLKHDPLAIARQAAAFLGCEPDVLPEPERHQSNSGFVYSPAGQLLHSVIGTDGMRRLNSLAKRTAPGLANAAKSFVASPVPAISEAEATLCRALFAEDAGALQADLGVETRRSRWWADAL